MEISTSNNKQLARFSPITTIKMAPTAAAATVVAPNNENILPYILYRSRTNKSTSPASVVEGSVPVIDVEGLYDLDRRSSTIDQIGDACANYGFFMVKNHGVPESIRNKMFQSATDFFHLPDEEKMKFASTDRRKKVRYVAGNHFDGNTEPTDSSWRTSLKFPFDDDTEEYPANPPSYKEDIAAYSASMQVLVKTVLDAISESLGLEKDYLTKTIKNYRLSAATNHYPICPNPEKHIGAISHSDPSVITVVQLIDPGLQFDYKGTWLPADPIPDALCINVGDVLQILSNDRYRSICHRVTANAEKERLSIATFCFPSSDAVMGPAEKLVDEEHPPQHSYFTFGQFLGNIIKRGEPSNCA